VSADAIDKPFEQFGRRRIHPVNVLEYQKHCILARGADDVGFEGQQGFFPDRTGRQIAQFAARGQRQGH
jgi:hypothetical protein